MQLPFKSHISFSFLDESLIGISIGPSLKSLKYNTYDVKQIYRIYNEALIKVYGIPNKRTKIFETKDVW